MEQGRAVLDSRRAVRVALPFRFDRRLMGGVGGRLGETRVFDQAVETEHVSFGVPQMLETIERFREVSRTDFFPRLAALLLDALPARQSLGVRTLTALLGLAVLLLFDDRGFGAHVGQRFGDEGVWRIEPFEQREPVRRIAQGEETTRGRQRLAGPSFVIRTPGSLLEAGDGAHFEILCVGVGGLDRQRFIREPIRRGDVAIVERGHTALARTRQSLRPALPLRRFPLRALTLGQLLAQLLKCHPHKLVRGREVFELLQRARGIAVVEPFARGGDRLGGAAVVFGTLAGVLEPDDRPCSENRDLRAVRIEHRGFIEGAKRILEFVVPDGSTRAFEGTTSGIGALALLDLPPMFDLGELRGKLVARVRDRRVRGRRRLEHRHSGGMFTRIEALRRRLDGGRRFARDRLLTTGFDGGEHLIA
jgi:hypothetical protein